MKRAATFFLLVASFIGALTQQAFSQTAKDIFNSTDMNVTYLGIDFTQAKVINDASAVGPDLKDRHFPGINQVVVNEPKKYDLAAAFKN